MEGNSLMEVRVEHIPERRVAVVPHRGSEDTVEETRRPLYRHLIMEELVGGPSMIRFHEDRLDLLVGTHLSFEGDGVATVELLPGGKHAVGDFEGPPEALPAARVAFLDAVAAAGHQVDGPLLQVHHMDPVAGVVEEQFQVLLT